MEIAILVFFLAIFGGVLFLLALIWFVFRRIRNRRPMNRNFASGDPNYGNQYASSEPDDDYTDSDDTSAAVYTDNTAFENPSDECSASEGTAHDNPHRSEHFHSHSDHAEYSAGPPDTSYSDNSASSDAGSSSESGSSSDSGSGSSSD